jgi:OOP family OmpA-OmpF porin
MFTQHDTSRYDKLMHGLSAAVLILGLAAIPQMAQAEGWYGGASLGQSKAKDITCDLDITCSSDDTDTGWKIYGGYQFNPNGAIEFGYVDLGKAKLNGTDSFLGATSADWETSGFTVALAGFIPVSQNFAFMGKVGLFNWDLDVNVSSSVFGSGSDTSSGTDLTYGLGLKFDMSKTTGVRVEWERFKDVGDDNSTGQSDVDLLSVGLVFKF